MKILQLLLSIVAFIIGFTSFLLIFSLILASIFDFRPAPKTRIEIENPIPSAKLQSNTLQLISWNIGYCGLGKEMDFFYDGGKKVRPDKSLYKKYFSKINDFLNQNKNLDFILLQEVDAFSKRSYRNNQVGSFANTLNKYCYSFAKNYDVPFVPLPPTHPMGRVKSGLLSFAKTTPIKAQRVSFSGNFAWPKNLFMLDRCFLVQRFKTSESKNLVLINTHNSAYDDGQLRSQQLEELKKFVLKEYDNGNYVIVGGDWNQNPPGYNPDEIISGYLTVRNDQGNIQPDFMPVGWIWAYDPNNPTNRSVQFPYKTSSTPTSIIDFFLLSPNIMLNKVNCINLNFEASDHNPVLIRVNLE